MANLIHGHRDQIHQVGDLDQVNHRIWDGVSWLSMDDFWKLTRIWNGSKWITMEEWRIERAWMGSHRLPPEGEVPFPITNREGGP